MIFAAYALLLAGQPAAPPEDPDCSGTTGQMVECVNRQFVEVERDLNDVWRGVAASLQEEDRQANDHLSSRLEIAQAAQQAWLAYRDAQCAADADSEVRGGSVYPLHYISCRTAMTEERIKRLRGG